MITKDYLPNHPEIELYQDDTMLRINTDTYVLGEFLNIYRNDTVLDMGTNQGALLLYANLFHPKKLIGLERNPEGVALAKRNMEFNHLHNAENICGDILTYKNDPVDVIICNPPYFKTKEDKKVEFLVAERKEDESRTYRILKRMPEKTAYGLDLYNKVFG